MSSRSRYNTPPNAPGFPGDKTQHEVEKMRRGVFERGLDVTGDVAITGSTGIGTASISSTAKLQVDSTTKGFLPPRMTTAEREAITSPDDGLVVYDTTVGALYCHEGGSWVQLSAGGGGGGGGISTVNDAGMLAMSASAGDIVYNTTYGGLWAYNGYVWLPAGPSTLNRVFDVKDDFESADGELDWSSFGSGGTIFLQSPEAGAPGAIQIEATTTGYRGIVNTGGTPGLFLFDDFRYFCWVARLGANQDTSAVKLGLSANLQSDLGSTVRGVFFQFDPGMDPDNWHAACVSEGTATTVDTGVDATNTDWHKFEAFYDGDEVTFYIDGNLVATIDSNLPTTSAGTGQLHWFCHVKRHSGNGPRYLFLDFARLIALRGQ